MEELGVAVREGAGEGRLLEFDVKDAFTLKEAISGKFSNIERGFCSSSRQANEEREF